MYQPFQSLVQPDPSVTNSYNQGERFERGIKNTEGMCDLTVYTVFNYLHFSGKSRLRGPIPADPGYGHEVRPFRYIRLFIRI